jgi:PAS domain S-box-containing protein
MSDISPELYFKDLFDKTGDLIHILNTDGEVMMVNASWLSHLGYTWEEVHQRSIYEFIKSDDHDLLRNYRAGVMNGNGAKEIAFEFISKEGRLVAVKGQVSMLDPMADMPYTYAILRDITAQKIIEQENEQTRARLSKFFRHAPDAVVVINEKQEVAEWNLKSELIFGYTYEEAFGIPLSELIIPHRYREAHLQGMARFIKTGVGPVLNKTIEISALHKNGSEFPVCLSISNVKIDEEWMFVAFVTDITERKALEALAIQKENELRQSQQLDEHKTNFLSVASHELKTPLTSIKGYTQIASKHAENSGDSKLVSFLSKINQQTNKLDHLIGDLMDMSKIETGKLAIVKRQVDFDSFLKDAIDSLRQVVEQHPVILLSSATVTVAIDTTRIEQVINNLVTNAAKYSESGSPIEISSYIKQQFLIVQVVDYGVGLAEENFDVIFDRFFRVKDISNHVSGFGIGLFICAEIIKQHHGHVWVESELGKGSTFNFSLPLSDE